MRLWDAITGERRGQLEGPDKVITAAYLPYTIAVDGKRAYWILIVNHHLGGIGEFLKVRPVCTRTQRQIQVETRQGGGTKRSACLFQADNSRMRHDYRFPSSGARYRGLPQIVVMAPDAARPKSANLTKSGSLF